jgi:pyruvate-formate lyase
VEYFTEIAARHQRLVYDTVRENGAMLMMSLLMDDCIERAKPLVGGGVRYLAGTYETYGNTTVSDSLTAIREYVYEKKLLTLRELVDILDADFTGHEDLRQLLLRCPKFGNDDPTADEMARIVNTHVFETTAAQAKAQGLSSYLVVMINNGANVDLGKNTLATADGRRAYTYLSNGNNPMAGMDHNGLPALLRSLASTRMDLTAGTAQNLKLSADLFRNHPDVVRDLIDTAFDMGILSLNISVMDRGEMEDAMIHPELHQNLFVRVGGFSARFVNLDSGTQADMLSRALY